MALGTAEPEQTLAGTGYSNEFDSFVRAQRETLVRFLHRRTRSAADAEDLAQESLTRLMRYRGHAPETWTALLYRIAVNALNDRSRRAASRFDAQHVSLDDGAELATGEPSHEQRTASQQELVALQRALLRLPDRCRQIYLLHRIEGMTYTEIADHCGISVKAVEKHISRALHLLRERLGALHKELKA
ncbi:MAG TPA: RNA polymerase sigma factor [Dyella sp.]|nr:RNA polymerase sigma factor [Dyella sp.]